MNYIAYPGTAAHLDFPVATDIRNVEHSCVLIVDRDTVHLLEDIKPFLPKLKALGVAYYSLRDQSFKRLDEWFFESVATPLFELIQLCNQQGTAFIDSALNAYSIKELFSDKYQAKQPPKRLFVELTKNCNSCCRMCLTRVKNPQYQSFNLKHNMKFELFKQIADCLFPTAEFIDLRGFGESTLLPNFKVFVDYALKFGKQLGLVTNLSVQDDSLWKYLMEHNFVLDVSIDGATQPTYEYIRHGLKWEHIMHNLQLLSQYPNASLLFTVQKHNIHEMAAIVELAHQHRIPRVKFAAVNPEELFNEVYSKFTHAQVEFFFKQVPDEGVEWLSRFPGKPWTAGLCIRPWDYLFINHDGSLSACNGFLTEQGFGSFKGAWQDFYNTPPFLALRAALGKPHEFIRCSWCNANRRN